jgi:uncharacterized delta-60 repeat protein
MASNIFAAGGILDTTFNGTGKTVFNIEDGLAPGSFADIAVIAGNKFLTAGRVIAGEYYNVGLSRYNADGSLDTTFGTGGKVITDCGVETEVKALAVQPDGKIVVLGSHTPYPFPYAVVIRYTADGALDTSFGTNGIFFSAVERPQDIKVGADNKIYILGYSAVFPSPNPGIQLARINANGTADTSFGNNGIASGNGGGEADQMAFQPDGKIVITATAEPVWTYIASIIRLNANGTLDSGFGVNGRRDIGGMGSGFGDIRLGGGVALQPDGKIVLAGWTWAEAFFNSGLFLARLNTDGSLDTSFSSDGIIVHDLSPTMDRSTDIAVQGDGKILISGTRGDSTAIAVRCDLTGALDATFGTGGVVLLTPARNATAIALQGSDIVVVGDDGYERNVHLVARLSSTGTVLSQQNTSFIVGKNDYALDAAIQSDKKIVTVGFSTSPAGITVIAVARLLQNGNLDPDFGTGGRVVFNDGNNLSQAYAVKIQPDGKIVVVGKFAQFSWSSPSLYVIRLNTDGSLDNTFGTGGKAILNYTANTGVIGNDLEFQPDGKIVVCGSHWRPGNEGTYEIDMMAARLNPNGTPDGGFGNGGFFTQPTGIGYGPHEQANALSIQPDGKIILAGSHLLRLTSNGAIDPGFPVLAPVDFGASDMALRFDGKILLSGTKNTDLAIAQYNSNAAIDTSFGINGVATLDFGGTDNGNALYLDPNGDIVAGGSTLGGSPSRRKFALARFKPNGSPDPAFGAGGKVITDFGGDAEIFGLARQSDGKIVAAGSAKINIDKDYAVARYNSSQIAALFDFDGDSKSDISIFRPSVGEWWILKSSNGGNAAFQFGNSADKIVPADYTGDGKTDGAIFRPSTGEWFILRSEDSSYYSFPFGMSGDLPAAGDFDGDGRADVTIFRPSTATWYVSKSGGGTMIEQFGLNGDIPAVGDYDGDGKADIAIWRATWGQWWIKRSTLGILAFDFGNSADKPIPGDYTGDGKTDVAIYRPSTGEWFVLRSEDQSYYSFPFGLSTDIPAPGDYDGDGKFDPAVFRPSTSTWYANRSTSGLLIQSFGQAGDKPVPSAFVP